MYLGKPERAKEQINRNVVLLHPLKTKTHKQKYQKLYKKSMAQNILKNKV